MNSNVGKISIPSDRLGKEGVGVMEYTQKNSVSPLLPALAMAQHTYSPEQQWRDVDEKIDNLRREMSADSKELAGSIHRLTIALYEMKAELAQMKAQAKAHEAWANDQAKEIAVLKGSELEQRMKMMEQHFETRTTKTRIDLFSWLVMGGCTFLGTMLKPFWDWLNGR